MFDSEHEDHPRSIFLSTLLDRLGPMPLSELTPEQQRELHDLTNGVFRPSVGGDGAREKLDS